MTGDPKINEIARQAKSLGPQPRAEFLEGLPKEIRRAVEKQLNAAYVETAVAATGERRQADADTIPEAIGPYKIVRRIGRGGMGQVFLARQQQPIKRQVAVKVIKTDTPTKQILARFEAERQALAMMHHQHIAKVLDAGVTEDGRPYFAMELVNGIPITSYCDKHRLSANQRIELFIQTCRAIQHAHQKGIIHRDLKPSNVLVTQFDGQANVKVIDFGLAKALQDKSKLTDKTLFTQYGQVVGTLEYMSPEQADLTCLDIDTRTDVYSLGVILYELLTGSTPIGRQRLKGEAFDRILALIREEDPPRPSVRLSSLRKDDRREYDRHHSDTKRLTAILKGDLDWITMKALEKDTARRYDTAAALADDAQRFLHDEPIEARPPSLDYRLRKAFDRHRVGFLTALTVLGLLVVGMITTGSMWRYAVAEANRATTAEGVAEKRAVDVGIQRDRAVEAEIAQRKEKLKAEAALARSTYQLAVARWEDHRADEAIEYLDAIPEQYRGFEWNLAWQQFQGSDFICFGHTAAVNCVAFSPDGTQIVSASRDSEIRLWDSVTGKPLATYHGDRGNPIFAVSFSPDGNLIAFAGGSGTIELLDARNGDRIRSLVGHSSSVRSFVFSRDGKLLVSTGKPSSRSQVIKVWNVRSGEARLTINQESLVLPSFALSPDSKRIAAASHVSAGRPGTVTHPIKIWDTADGQLLKTIAADNATTISFHPDGSKLVCTGLGTVDIWDIESGKKTISTKGHAGFLKTAIFSPDGSRIAAAGSDKTVRVWDAYSGDEIITMPGHLSAISQIAFSPNGRRLVSGSVDHTVRVWDTRCGDYRRLLQHQGTLKSIAYSPDGGQLASTASFFDNLRLWDVEKGKVLWQTTGIERAVDNALIIPPGKLLAAAGSDKEVKIYECESGNLLHSLQGHQDRITGLCCSPDGSVVATASWDGPIILWDISQGTQRATIATSSPIESLAFSPNGQLIASGNGGANGIDLWDVSTGKKESSLVGACGRSLRFSPDGSLILGGGIDRRAKLWTVDSGKKVREFGKHVGHITSLAYSSDGLHIASADRETIKLWDAASGVELRTLAGFQSLNTVAFNPNGVQLAASCLDGTIHLWDILPGKEFRFLDGPGGGLETIAFSNESDCVQLRAAAGQPLQFETLTGRPLAVSPGLSGQENKNHLSPNGRWLLIPSESRPVLVDLQFRDHPEQQRLRRLKAEPDPVWHANLARAAKKRQDWFSAACHAAWALRADPSFRLAKVLLQTSMPRLKLENADLISLLPATVRATADEHNLNPLQGQSNVKSP